MLVRVWRAMTVVCSVMERDGAVVSGYGEWWFAIPLGADPIQHRGIVMNNQQNLVCPQLALSV